MKGNRAISRMLIAVVIVIIIVIAGVVGYYLTMPTTPAIKDTLVMGTTDSVETNLDPAHAYDYFGWEIIRSLGAGLVDYRPGATGSWRHNCRLGHKLERFVRRPAMDLHSETRRQIR